MAKVFSSALGESTNIDRVIGHLSGNCPGPTVVFFAGIHGNEPAGVFALKHVLNELRVRQTPIYGQIYAIAGNLKALQANVRFLEKDLNRIWTVQEINQIANSAENLGSDEKELWELYQLLLEILSQEKAPYYFIDLHTTSSETAPFVVLNDSMLNRKFASNYPLPIILGIEEYLVGALLSYINELGYVSLGYESGQHDDISSIRNSIDFIFYTLNISGAVQLSTPVRNVLEQQILSSDRRTNTFYEIYYQHKITKGNRFKMLPGFRNFQIIPKGRDIAEENNKPLVTSKKRQIFMPLYQELGSEGFYFIRTIPRVLLWISKGLRWFRVDGLLVYLPGIQWASLKKDVLLVDQRIARFMAKSFFHLLGYRARRLDKTHLVVKNREAASRNWEYKDSKWY
ncbi:succinylglutamate desuccinylase/aspartoacylase family protein [Flagellimonas flava]|uniref:Succinylglutamate desuccinylase / Aspartoacylase family protein n=1 Tax=Flagellimonas flava TaxID=570519 RepID=A0A1M5LSN7_9FLAO|nr:succinylglutamate desuccinylase/aspartoacylase family protein [Allomuricauda flava]SHG68144.1 Succinylglutamate desuccinylase / Aspartoacylase family protein [Allomuricauda flava]